MFGWWGCLDVDYGVFCCCGDVFEWGVVCYSMDFFIMIVFFDGFEEGGWLWVEVEVRGFGEN